MAKDKRPPAKQSAATPQRLDQQIERLFEDFFNRRWPAPGRWPRWDEVESTTPRVDVVDRENDVLVRAELPGMSKEDVDVSISGDAITIKGSTRKEEEHEDGDYHRREIVSSTVSRTVALPGEVDGDQAKAQLKDGMLEVIIPKVEKAKRKRIQVGS